MDEQAFRRQLEQGRGGAVLWAQTHDVTPWREHILHACKHNLVYDRQCEDTRGVYLYDLVQATGEPSFYRNEILAALQSPKQDEDNGQLGELARLFAETGDGEARRVLYTAFAREAAENDFRNAWELVKLDGLDGLLFAVERLAAREDAEERWELEEWISELEERDGEKEAQGALSRAAASLPELARLLEPVLRSREKNETGRAASDEAYEAQYRIPYAGLRKLIEERGSRLGSYLFAWGKRAADADIEAAAEDLLREEDADRLRAYLTIFSKRRFPLCPDRLIAVARTAQGMLARRAMQALALIEGPAIRALALELAEDPAWADQAVRILTINYEAGDLGLIERLLSAPHVGDGYHWIGMSVQDFVKAHPGLETAPALTLIYQNGPCSNCRRSCVRELLQQGALPDWMRAECRWDADLETRRLVQEGVEVNDRYK